MNLIKTTRETLLKPLQAVSGIIERRHTLPILSNVLVMRDGGRLAFVATDIEIEITARTETDAPGEDKAITVGARR
jgi:DNA polymerase III subunit beta